MQVWVVHFVLFASNENIILQLYKFFRESFLNVCTRKGYFYFRKSSVNHDPLVIINKKLVFRTTNWVALTWRRSQNIYFCKLVLWTLLPGTIDIVYFTTRVPDTSETSATRVQHEWHTCDTSEKRATRMRHGCHTNDTMQHKSKILILLTAIVKTYFHTPILAI